MHSWLLPEFIEDVLPPEAWRIERIRRQMLDLFRGFGYQLVIPPLLEYVESLLTGTGRDLDLSTFKLVDQLSGRHMGIRADITPQAARIDAHLMNQAGVNRLCYAGSVLRTLPEGMARSRELLQIGAELFGHTGIESDIEIQLLMLQALEIAGIPKATVDLGHAQIFRTLALAAGLKPDLESELFMAIQRKDKAAALESIDRSDSSKGTEFSALLQLSGGFEVLDEAARVFGHYPAIVQALGELRAIGEILRHRASVSFDLGELRGYHYHSGIVFAAYAEGYADALARGGRYDEVGKAFGHARPATGFSLDLREIVAGLEPDAAKAAILAPHDPDPRLASLCAQLRAAGERVMVDLPTPAPRDPPGECDRRIERGGGGWEVVAL
jgi:ATP phosphoribosyltransferase regulatory subunit